MSNKNNPSYQIPVRNAPYTPFDTSQQPISETQPSYTTDRVLEIDNTQIEDEQESRGFKVFFPRFSYKSFIFIISMIQLTVFIITECYSAYLDKKNGFSCVLYRFGSKYTPAIVTNYEFYRLFLPIFLHGGFRHIAMNMLSQWMFGFHLERYHGTKRFMLIYFLSGIGGNLLSAVSNVNNPSVGASSALFGVVALRIFYIIENYDRLGPRKNFRLLFLGAMVLGNIQNARYHSTIDNSAHIGGFIVGAFLAIIFFKATSDIKFYVKKVLALIGLVVFMVGCFVIIMMMTGLEKAANNFETRCDKVFSS